MSAAFRALPDVKVPGDHAPLELGPKESLLHGVLANGMTCAAPLPPHRCRQHAAVQKWRRSAR